MRSRKPISSKFQQPATGVRHVHCTTVIHCDPDILSGEPVFVGTRVFLQNLIDYLAAGDSLEKFLDAFPSVSRQQAIAALELAGEALAERAHPH